MVLRPRIYLIATLITYTNYCIVANLSMTIFLIPHSPYKNYITMEVKLLLDCKKINYAELTVFILQIVAKTDEVTLTAELQKQVDVVKISSALLLKASDGGRTLILQLKFLFG